MFRNENWAFNGGHSIDANSTSAVPVSGEPGTDVSLVRFLETQEADETDEGAKQVAAFWTQHLGTELMGSNPSDLTGANAGTSQLKPEYKLGARYARLFQKQQLSLHAQVIRRKTR